MKKTFADVKVGDTLYFCTKNMNRVLTTLVTSINIILDGKHIPQCCDQSIVTNDGLCVQMSRCIIDKHNCFIDINGTCIGTSPDVVANHILKEINRKIADLQRYKEKIENNMNIDYGVTHWAVIK